MSLEAIISSASSREYAASRRAFPRCLAPQGLHPPCPAERPAGLGATKAPHTWQMPAYGRLKPAYGPTGAIEFSLKRESALYLPRSSSDFVCAFREHFGHPLPSLRGDQTFSNLWPQALHWSAIFENASTKGDKGVTSAATQAAGKSI